MSEPLPTRPPTEPSPWKRRDVRLGFPLALSGALLLVLAVLTFRNEFGPELWLLFGAVGVLLTILGWSAIVQALRARS